MLENDSNLFLFTLHDVVPKYDRINIYQEGQIR